MTLDVEEGVDVMSTSIESHVDLTLGLTPPDPPREIVGNQSFLFVCHKAGVNKKVKYATNEPIAQKKLVS
jgi:hypothetical protein